MPKPPTEHIPKVRINIMIRPDLLEKIDEKAGKYERSSFIGEACKEKLAAEERK